MKKRDELTEVFILFVAGVVFLICGISSLIYYGQNLSIATDKNWFGSVMLLLGGIVFTVFSICYMVTENYKKY